MTKSRQLTKEQQSKAIKKGLRASRRVKYLKECQRNHVALGVCRSCAIRPKAEGRQRCELCLRKDRERHDRAYRKQAPARRALKQCVRCGREAMPGMRACGKCSETYAAQAKRQAEKRKADGRCIQCGDERAPSRVRCPACLEYMRKSQAKTRMKKKMRRAA